MVACPSHLDAVKEEDEAGMNGMHPSEPWICSFALSKWRQVARPCFCLVGIPLMKSSSQRAV